MAEMSTKYDLDALVQFALDEGFSQAGKLNMEALVYMPEVREMCSADRCHSYGKSWRCPPACGSIEEAAERTKQYSCGILVQSIGQMEDDFDYETIAETAKLHGERFVSMMRKLKAQYGEILAMGAGACRKCEKCTYPDAPCRFPDDSYSSMEAYGLWVSRVCELSGVPYNNGKQTITYTSCYLLK